MIIIFVNIYKLAMAKINNTKLKIATLLGNNAIIAVSAPENSQITNACAEVTKPAKCLKGETANPMALILIIIRKKIIVYKGIKKNSP